MTRTEKDILSALVGLTGAIYNNGKTPDTDRLVLQALTADAGEDMPVKIRREKFRISPSCESCTAPCGNTSDYDLARLEANEPELRALKLSLWQTLQTYAEKADPSQEIVLPEVVYKAISWISYDLEAEDYLELIDQLQSLS